MKISITNRKGQKIVVLLDLVKNLNDQKGLAFVMHGLGGFKEQLHIHAFANAFNEKGYSSVRFDTTNTIGESDGNYEDATTTNYYSDLEDVIAWAKEQKWYQEPFVLAGHSLGGICTALYAENHPEKVKALAPISTVVSGKLSNEVYGKKRLAEWEKKGWEIRPSASKPGVIKKLKWAHMMDRLKYDLLTKVNKLTMPVLLIVGDKDVNTPLAHHKILFDRLPGRKELHVIKNAEHTFRDENHLTEIKNIFLKWIDTL
ncbi:alpha/beta hydrolase [Candidatus Woesearchaeota archaeon]|nr:alpha/beta hydrolase [Candidatus Woesearchaeota archaeon]